MNNFLPSMSRAITVVLLSTCDLHLSEGEFIMENQAMEHKKAKKKKKNR